MNAKETEESGVSGSENVRPQFGNRKLTNEDDVFDHNAWDNVEWNAEAEEQAREKVMKNANVLFTNEQIKTFENDAHKYWNSFYDIHTNRFFKDRHWLFTEFPEVAPDVKGAPERVFLDSNTNAVSEQIEKLVIKENTEGQNDSKRFIFEMGCGVGNTIFPILQYSQDPNLFIYGCDFSDTAISVLKENESYDEKRCCAFVGDISSEDFSLPFEEGSIDIILLIFVLSAINPDKMQTVIKNAHKCLKKGGLVLFRDYGRYDLAQLRLKNGRCLSENFYARGDGTRVYFFTQEDIKTLFVSNGFSEVQNWVDRRLQVNRGKKLMMYRVWIQGKYRKE